MADGRLFLAFRSPAEMAIAVMCTVQGGAVAPPRAHGGRQRGGGQQQQRQRIRLTQGK